MARSRAEVEAELRRAVDPQFRERLLARGVAQSMIRREGVLPEDAPRFGPLLDYDLLNYGYSLLSVGLHLLEQGAESEESRAAFLQASNALEAATKNSSTTEDLYFHRLVAGAASHLGGYAARAYSLVRTAAAADGLTGPERALADLILRALDEIETRTIEMKTSRSTSDEAILEALASPGDVENFNTPSTESDSIDPVPLLLSENFLSAVSAALFALANGESNAFDSAIADLAMGREACGDLSMVGPWWIHRLSVRLLSDLATTSIRAHVPSELLGASGDFDWTELRENFIATLFARDRAEIDLWPSQLHAVGQVFGNDEDLVIALPTSSGKTRIAELCILAALGRGQRVIYVTPLRALSAQTELTLQETFTSLGARVSSLYGAIGTSDFDEDVLRTSEIVVATPEKLDFALRSDPDLLNDVGLVVLDEGHMIGRNEREVRYEAQIQRLLRRRDADSRRIVCLSAVLPSGQELEDFVNWITGDVGDGLLREEWRPTQQRFGLLEWRGDHARMSITLGSDRPFIPRFLEARMPTRGTRRNAFPNNQQELTLATAWKLVEEQQTVLIYCPQRNSVESYAGAVVKLHRQGLLPSLLDADADLSAALAVGAEWFGAEHPILESLKLGVAIHHGTLPASYRREIEALLRSNVMRVTVASPTLAQGLNLSASTVLFHGLRRGRSLIDAPEFRNVIGRAGRAFVDSEGLVLCPLFDPSDWRRQEWLNLTENPEGKNLESGLIGITIELIQRVVAHLESRQVEGFIAYLTGGAGWALPSVRGENLEDTETARRSWERNLALLDTAILSTVGDEDAEGTVIAEILAEALEGSLWERQLEHFDGAARNALREVVMRRSQDIWAGSTAVQRRGWYLSGLGMNPGREVDGAAEGIIDLLLQAERAINDREYEAAADMIVGLAEAVYSLSPFAVERPLPNWREVLRQWVMGEPLGELSEGKMAVARFIEDDVVYRLAWGLEAVRVYQAAQGDLRVDLLTGDGLAAIETGTFNRSASALMRAGFDFRSAAIAAVESTRATFSTQSEVRGWLRDLDRTLLIDTSWPTPASRDVWENFVQRARRPRRRRWIHETPVLSGVQWTGKRPKRSEWLRVTDDGDGHALLWSGGFEYLGRVESALNPSRQGVLRARRTGGRAVRLDYRGPRDLLARSDR